LHEPILTLAEEDVMSAQGGATSAAPSADTSSISNLYQEGIVAGLIGAATIAVWFLVLDSIGGRPFYTPNVLGTALFRRGEGLASPETLSISLEMVLMFTWVHGLAFAAIGGIVAWLLSMAERNPNIGFGFLILFVILEFGFLVVAMIFAAPVLRALAWPAVVVANLLAAAAMAGYFRLRHPNLMIRP
jgi:hypothetical protein